MSVDALEPFDIKVPPPGWAPRIARFDVENFGADAWSEYSWTEALAIPEHTYLTVSERAQPGESLGRLVAVGGVSGGPEAELLTIAVGKNYRRRGIGAALLDLLLAIVDSNADVCFLEVRISDDGAQAMYCKAGFVPIGVRKRYYRDEDALAMRRDKPGGPLDSTND